MKIQRIEVGPFQSNCFLVSRPDAGSLVIDPGSDGDVVVEHLRRAGQPVAGILVTHGHMDHLSALAEVREAFPDAPVFMHPADASWAFGPANCMPPYYPVPPSPAVETRAVVDGQELVVGGWTVHVIGTPGHTPGGVCFHLKADKLLFTGDTLFAGSVGRTDLPGGSSRTLSASLKKLVRLPDDTTVFAGHGESTTIGREKESNFFLSRIPDIG